MGNEVKDFLDFKRKTALSSVITTLIIVLVAVILVIVVWGVVHGVVQTNSQKVALGQYTLALKLESAKLSADNSSVIINVKRGSGSGNFSALNFIFSDGKNSRTITENGSLSEGDAKNYVFKLADINLNGLQEISIAPVFNLSSGVLSQGDIIDTFKIPTTNLLYSANGTNRGPPMPAFEELGFSGAGREGYNIPYGKSTVEIKNVVIDPLDVHRGANQNLTVSVYSPNGIKNVTAFTQLDTSNLTLNLVRIANDSGGETWFKNWTVYDTHDHTYRTTFTAYDFSGNKDSVTLTWTDPCSPQQGANWNVLSNCTLGVDEVNGVDDGNITIAANTWITLNTNSVLVRTSGYAINFPSSANGGIIYSDDHSASVRSAYLYYYDTDGDGYPNNSTMTWSSSSSVSGEVRAKDAHSGTDCNPTNANVYVTKDVAQDYDQDGYVNTSFSSECVGASETVNGRTYYENSSGSYGLLASGESLGSSDCDDYNANVHPGQTAYFTISYIVPDGPGPTYDYNCDGTETPEYTTGGSCTLQCTDSGLGTCSHTGSDSVGWVSSTPSCGSSASYYTTNSLICPTPEPPCSNPTCSTTTKTQACH